MTLKLICTGAFLLLVISVHTQAYFEQDSEQELDDKERGIQKQHEIDNPFPSIRDYRVWRSLFETPKKRIFCPGGFVHNPVSGNCLPSLSCGIIDTPKNTYGGSMTAFDFYCGLTSKGAVVVGETYGY